MFVIAVKVASCSIISRLVNLTAIILQNVKENKTFLQKEKQHFRINMKVFVYVCILSRSGIFLQCSTFSKNLSGYNFLFLFLLVLEKENFLFLALVLLKTFPLILSLLKSHIQIPLLRISLPSNTPYEKGVGEHGKSQVATFLASHACSYL